MNKAKKALLLVLCAALLVGGTIAGTAAYLTQKVSITNTFTVGDVSITMVESVVDEYGERTTGTTATGNSYKLIPGHLYVKDPTITVGANSEDCYVFVKIENGLGSDATLSIDSNYWTPVETSGNTTVLMHKTAMKAKETASPFSTFTFSETGDPSRYADATIVVTAYAIQADGLTSKTPAEIWALAKTAE